jgi:hypothetical protein
LGSKYIWIYSWYYSLRMSIFPTVW